MSEQRQAYGRALREANAGVFPLMPLKLPIYVITGDQQVSLEATEDGGMDLKGWDFELKKMTRAAADWDDIIGFSGDADWRQVTKQEFDDQVKKLRQS